MAEAVYILCGFMSSLVAWLLYRHYQKVPMPLLLWSCLCFVGLAAGNILLFVDMVMTDPSVDLSLVRTIPGMIGIAFLIYGIIWDQP